MGPNQSRRLSRPQRASKRLRRLAGAGVPRRGPEAAHRPGPAEPDGPTPHARHCSWKSVHLRPLSGSDGPGRGAGPPRSCSGSVRRPRTTGEGWRLEGGTSAGCGGTAPVPPASTIIGDPTRPNGTSGHDRHSHPPAHRAQAPSTTDGRGEVCAGWCGRAGISGDSSVDGSIHNGMSPFTSRPPPALSAPQPLGSLVPPRTASCAGPEQSAQPAPRPRATPRSARQPPAPP